MSYELIPKMTSNTTPSGRCIPNSYVSGQEYRCYYAFDRNTSTYGDVYYGSAYALNGYITYEFASPVSINAIYLSGTVDGGGSITNNSGFIKYENTQGEWITLTNFSSINEGTWFKFNTIDMVRAIKFGCTSSSNGKGIIFNEIQAFNFPLEENITLEDNPLEFELQDNVSLQANFEISGYQVTTQSSPSDYGTTSGGGTYQQGQSVTISATPNIHRQFKKWIISGLGGYSLDDLVTQNNDNITTQSNDNIAVTLSESISYDNPYTFTMPSNSVSCEAQFETKSLIECIYDRTQEDIINRTSKAYLNIQDWNRIENNIDYVDFLYGKDDTYKNWVYTDIPNQTEVATVLDKLNDLKEKVVESPPLPTTILNYEDVNKIEYFLYFMYEYYFHRIEVISQPVSGFYNANEPNVLMAERN